MIYQSIQDVSVLVFCVVFELPTYIVHVDIDECESMVGVVRCSSIARAYISVVRL